MDHPTAKASAEKTAYFFAVVFGNCHRGYNSSRCMSNADINEPGYITLIITYNLIRFIVLNY